jgi:hypothetical protein
MDWINNVEQIFQKYSGQVGGTAAAPADPHADFHQVAKVAPPDEVASGISQAFRSDQTPPFGEMVAKLFSNSDPTQRAGLLNRILQSVGPRTLASLPALSGLSSVLSGGTITPEQASQVSPGQVQQIAAHAEGQNPAVVDQVSGFYAQHPQVMKAVGGLALTIALQHILKRR